MDNCTAVPGIRLSACASIRALAVVVTLILASAPAHAAQFFVPSGASISDAVARAVPGDEIVLEAGGVYTELITLPDKGSGLPITIRSSATLPERRIGPGDRSLLPSLGSGTTMAPITITGSRWRLVGLAFRANSTGSGNIIDVVGTAAEVVIDRVLIEGGAQGQKRGVAMNGGGAITVTRSYVSNIWRTGQDSQALASWDGRGPFTITDNYLEAASENIMFGGADSSSEARMPADILVEGNHLTKRLAWKGVSGYVVKNLFELKAARRAVIRNNLMENNWVDGQTGWAIVVTPRNQNGGAPWTAIEDVLFEGNVVRSTTCGVNITGRDDLAVSRQTRRVTLRHNVFVTDSEWLQAAGEIGELTLDHNTVINGSTLMKLAIASIHEGTYSRTADYAIGHLTLLNSLMQHGAQGYGIWGEASGIGTVALTYHTNSYDVRRNVVAGENGWGMPYPPDTLQPSYAEHAAQFTAPDYLLVSDSKYRGAALDGTDMGAVRGGSLPPPPPTQQPPIVTLSGASVTAPARVQLTASASDPDGAIARVDFFAGLTLLGSDTAAPFEASGRFAPGTYAVKATAVDNLGAVTSATTTVTVLPAPALPAPWTAQDLGAVGIPGTTALANGVFTVQASGADVWGTADRLHYVWQRVSGDVDVIARVASIDNVHAWTKAGVMIRHSLTADSPHAFMMATPGKGFAFQRRVVIAGISTNTSGGAGTAPAWVKLERRGSTITAFHSPNGVTWTLVGSDTFAMPADIHVGLALSSHDDTRLAGATFDNVTVRLLSAPRVSVVTSALPEGHVGVAYSATLQATGGSGAVAWRIDSGTLPAGLALNAATGAITGVPSQAGAFPLVVRATDAVDPSNTATASLTLSVLAATPAPPPAPVWTSQDIGFVGLSGSMTVDANGKFTIRASGADVWGTADALHYAWQRVSGDVDIIARVSTVENVHPSTKVGVMIRESLAANSANAFILGSPSKAIAFQRRVTAGGVSTSTSGGTDAMPVWMKLERRGTVIRAYRSSNGNNWHLVGSDTFPMGQDVYVGLALTSHDNTRLAGATLGSVTVRRFP